MSDNTTPSGPDFSQGLSLHSLGNTPITAGRVGDDPAMLVRLGDDWVIVGATCTHYSGPLPEGLLDGDQIHCPWHHACFDLRSGRPVSPPALNPIPRWRVELKGDTLTARERLPDAEASAPATRGAPARIVIVGAGAAGAVAIETLRAEGYAGRITVIDRDGDAPYDRPNLSKDYLAGTAPEEWLPLRSSDFYKEHDVTLLLGRAVASLDPSARTVTLDDGSAHGYDALLLATGAHASPLPGGLASPKLYYLRSLADSRAIRTAAANARAAVVIGASFIGLEVAAALRQLGLDVHVVAPEAKPLARVFGDELADFVRALHGCAVLLEPTLRHVHLLRRTRPKVGRPSRGRFPSQWRLRRHVFREWQTRRGGHGGP